MKLPVCVFDIESDMLCPSCQDKLDSGVITDFDVEFCKWLIENGKQYPELEKLTLLRAVKTDSLLILVVKKKNRDILQSEEELMGKIAEEFGEVLIMEGPAKLRTVVRSLILPAIEVGVNSLYLPNGFKESIVKLRTEDRERIAYSKEQLRAIVSAVVGESVLFQYQDERDTEKEEEKEEDEFDKRMKDFGRR